MTGTSTATWGIGDPQFLVVYGALCVAAVIGMWWAWRTALGAQEGKHDPLPDLDPAKLAMLSGGAQLAITTAATKLHREGRLRAGPATGTLEVAGELAPGAGALERELLETVRGEPGITIRAVRERVAGSEPVRAMAQELTRVGLLPEPSRAALLRHARLAGSAVIVLGLARIASGLAGGAPVGVLAVMIFAVVCGLWLIRRAPAATTRGSAIVARMRADRDDLRRSPAANDSVLAAALFGGGALWLAEPAIASTLGVPRENSRSWGPGYGTCSSGGGCATACSSSAACGGGGGGGGGGCGGGGS